MAAQWKIGTTKTITWTPIDVLSNVKIELSRNAGGTWETITANTANDGAYAWEVTAPKTTEALIRISGLNYVDPVDSHEEDFTDITDISDADFSILIDMSTGGGLSLGLNFGL